jgi:hypothetical protein
LEWTVSSPPPALNFDEPVIVRHGPYEYGETNSGRDFVLQSDPEDVQVQA